MVGWRGEGTESGGHAAVGVGASGVVGKRGCCANNMKEKWKGLVWLRGRTS